MKDKGVTFFSQLCLNLIFEVSVLVPSFSDLSEMGFMMPVEFK
jgi:hypothetical protein